MSFDPDAPARGGGLYGLETKPGEARVVVIPVPWEATTSGGRGTRRGPSRILEASAQVDLEDLDAGPAWRHGIAMLDPDPAITEWGDRAVRDALAVIESGGGAAEAAGRVNALSGAVNESVRTSTGAILDDGRIPAIVGGDHSVSYGAIQATAERHPGLGILHIDAHADLRPAYEGFTWSHASVMRNLLDRIPEIARLVQVAVRDLSAGERGFIRENGDRVTTWFDPEIARALAEGSTWMSLVERIIAPLPETIWISLDVDGLDPSLCPATGTPVPGGLSFRDVVLLLGTAAARRRIVGFDLVETGDGAWDGNVSARLLYKLCGWAAGALTK